MCFKNTFLWIRFMKTLIRCALQYVADKYVHNKKSERVNLWDFLIIGGKLWGKSTFNVPQKSPTFVGLFRYFAWVWATPPHDAHAWVHLYIGPEGHFRMMIKDQNDEVGIGRHSKREFLRRNVIRLNLLSNSQAPFGNRNPLNEDQNDGQNNKPQLWRGATVDCRVVLDQHVDQQSASPRRFTCLLE